MATKAPARARKPKSEQEPSALLETLKFVSVAQHSDGLPYQTHCRIAGGTVIAFDGGMAVGSFVDEELNVCPNTKILIAALEKCKERISITELDSGRLSVKSGKFRALVPCLPFGDLQAIEPDVPCANISDALKPALAAVLPLTVDSDAEPFKCAVLLQAQTVVATNRHVIIEAWHGIDLPPGLLIPRASANAIAKSKKPLKLFGFSHNSATFYFEDNSFIRTQLFESKFPAYERVLNIDTNPWPLPGGFYEALDNVATFSEDGRVYFRDGKMCSHIDDESGASFEVDGLKNDLCFNIEYLNLIREHAHKMHFDATANGMSAFFGDNVRGGIMKVSKASNGS